MWAQRLGEGLGNATESSGGSRAQGEGTTNAWMPSGGPAVVQVSLGGLAGRGEGGDASHHIF